MTSLSRPAATRMAQLALLAALCGFAAACRQNSENGGGPPPVADQQRFEVVFPDTLRADDPTVNLFVRRLIDDCVRGDYDAFRLLWSARDEPIPRGEYEEGWQAVSRVEIRSLQKMLLDRGDDAAAPEPETAYVLALHVTLDPTHPAARREPQRNVVLMLVREHDQWRIARTPKHIRAWARETVVEPDPGASENRAPEQGGLEPD